MPKSRRFNYREITILLKQNGFYLYRQGRGSHEQWARDIDRKIVTVPNHGKKTISFGVVKNILKALNDDKGTVENLKKLSKGTKKREKTYKLPDLKSLRSLFKEAREEYKAGKTKGFRSTKKLIEFLEND